MKIGEHAAWDERYEATKGFLHEREQAVWEYRRQGLSLEAIAVRIGRTRERVRQIENKAWRKIKYYSERENASEVSRIQTAFSARLANALLEYGCETLDGVRHLVESGGLKNVGGIGRTSENEARVYFGLPPR